MIELGLSPIAFADSPVSLAPVARIIWACSQAGVVGLSANSGEVAFRSDLGTAYCSHLVRGVGAVWMAGGETENNTGLLAKINIATGAAKTILKIRGAVSAVASSAGRVWLVAGPQNDARVLIVNARTGRVAGTVAGAKHPVAIAADNTGVWIATAQGQLLHAGAAGASAHYVLSLPTTTANGLTAPPVVSLGSGSVWVAAGEIVLRVDERSLKVLARIQVPGTPFTLAVGGGALWAGVFRLPNASRLVKVDVRDDAVIGSASVPFASSSVAVGAGGVWLGLARAAPRVFRVDPRSLRLHLLANLR
jgi:hypothetical protein